MIDRALPVVLRLTRAWTRVYTYGLPPAVATVRVEEVDCDVWEMCHDPNGGTPATRLAVAIIRLAAGMADDIGWRAEQASMTEAAFARRVVAFAIATAVIGSMLALPAWRFGGGRNVATCAASANQPESTAHLRHDVIRCAGAFFSAAR